MGITRVILAMRAEGVEIPAPPSPKVYVAGLGAAAASRAAAICERLRREGVYAECDLVGRSLKAQMKYANKLGAAYTLIIGDSELETGKAMLRDMRNSTQTEVELDGFTVD